MNSEWKPTHLISVFSLYLFPVALWYYAKGVNTDVNMEIQIFSDVRWLVSSHPFMNGRAYRESIKLTIKVMIRLPQG